MNTSATPGRAGLALPRHGLGCAPIGNLYRTVTESDALATVRRAWDTGMRLFDTAPLYGTGVSERRLGRALCGLRRTDVVLSTKVGRRIVGGKHKTRAIRDLSYDGVFRSLDESLVRLNVDRVDIVHVHDPTDVDEAIRGALRALVQLREEGVIRAVGVGMNTVAELCRFARETDLDCILMAGRYTLLDQTAATNLLPLCASRGIRVIAGGVYNSGLLADLRPGAPYNYRPAPDHVLKRAYRIRDMCLAHGVPLTAAAVNFPFSHPAVASVIVGARTAQEVEENVAAMAQPIPDKLWSDLRASGLLTDEPTVS